MKLYMRNTVVYKKLLIFYVFALTTFNGSWCNKLVNHLQTKVTNKCEIHYNFYFLWSPGTHHSFLLYFVNTPKSFSIHCNFIFHSRIVKWNESRKTETRTYWWAMIATRFEGPCLFVMFLLFWEQISYKCSVNERFMNCKKVSQCRCEQISLLNSFC